VSGWFVKPSVGSYLPFHERIHRMRRSVKRALGAGVLSGIAYAAWRAWNTRLPDRTRGVEWDAAPFPFPPVPRDGSAVPKAAKPDVWVEANADGSCPETHPVKAKLASGIFHVPGGANYSRTKADRCYVDEAAAVADGLRPSKV
jgi:hypothetical protein